MDQMTLFELSYKYIMDTSSILSQKPGEPHNRLVYKSKWGKIEDYMKAHIIVTCSEVKEEIKDTDIGATPVRKLPQAGGAVNDKLPIWTA